MADILYLSKLHRCFFTCCCNNNEQKWGCIDHERVIFIQHALQCWLSTNYFVTKVMKMARIWKSKVFVSSLQRNFSDKSFSVVQESFLSTSTPQSWKKYWNSIYLLFPNFVKNYCWLVSWFYIFGSHLCSALSSLCYLRQPYLARARRLLEWPEVFGCMPNPRCTTFWKN